MEQDELGIGGSDQSTTVALCCPSCLQFFPAQMWTFSMRQSLGKDAWHRPFMGHSSCQKSCSCLRSSPWAAVAVRGLKLQPGAGSAHASVSFRKYPPAPVQGSSRAGAHTSAAPQAAWKFLLLCCKHLCHLFFYHIGVHTAVFQHFLSSLL